MKLLAIIMVAALFSACGSGGELFEPPQSNQPGVMSGGNKICQDTGESENSVHPKTWLVVGQSNAADGRMAWAFADAMREAGKPIAILNATFGGTAIKCWRRGEFCFENYIKPYINTEISGILYWQGEQDASGLADAWQYLPTPCDNYGDELEALIEEYRDIFGDVPFVSVILQTVIPSKNTDCEKLFHPDDFESDECPDHETDRWKLCRESQRSALLNIENTYAIEIEDITERGKVHPSNAYLEIGRRASAIATAILDE